MFNKINLQNDIQLNNKTLPAVDVLRIEANRLLDPKKKSALGQFFTPASICEFMASLFSKIEGEIKLLDPGCGVGSLSSAFLDESLKRNKIKSLDLVCYDIDRIIEPCLTEAMKIFEKSASDNGVGFIKNMVFEDFILNNCGSIAYELFDHDLDKFSHIIMNPPYKKISSKSEHRSALSSIGIETVKFEFCFCWLGFKIT